MPLASTSPTGWSTATVGPDCLTASLSTTLCVLGPAAGLPLAAKEKVAARWQLQPAEKVELTETPDWKQRVVE